MKKIKIAYWIFTGLLFPVVGYGSIMGAIGDVNAVKVITSLGYPAYLSPFLGATKILALTAIFVPVYPRLREWAYAGLAFELLGAIYSQIAVANPVTYIIFPTLTLGLVFGSYFMHHKLLENIPGKAIN